MFRKLMLPAFVAGLILAACSGAPQGTTQPAENPSQPPAEISATVPVPQASETATENPPSIKLPVVGVGEPEATPTSEEVGSGIATLEPESEGEQSGGGVMVAGDVQIDSIEVLVEQGDLSKVTLHVKGTLPTPCHQFAYTLGQPDENGVINIEVYSQVDPDLICAMVLQPFDETIDLGSFPPGTYSIMVNGELVQELDLSA